ncbi:DUF1853 family protein [Salinimicrobium sp. GXAS 041]|uniref:DUF1853 family protein n=1 Tax=Salinimicrobium sp. GXAS 041 TaxID=3400806 RepID=UPI003C77C147
MQNTYASKRAFLNQFLGFLKTPPLWRDHSLSSFSQYVLDENISAEELQIELFPPAMVLGKRIERFLRIYLDHFSDEDVLAENVQVFSDKVTLGEFDFILKNRNSGAISHVEVVYKFYLYDPTFPEEVDRWIGPNKKDSLHKKLLRLENRQFPLLYKQEAAPLLKHFEIDPEKVIQKALFKANLFVPLEKVGKHLPLINNECIQGVWIRYQDFTNQSFGSYQFFSPKKPDWPTLPEKGTDWYSYSEIKEELETFIEKKRSPLLWMKKNSQDYQRFFVVWW